MDWGKIQLAYGEQALSDVQYMGSPGNLRTFTLLSNKYGFGTGNFVISIRGSDVPFTTNSVIPAWITYTGAITAAWSYVQARIEGA